MNNNYITISELNKYLHSKFENDNNLKIVYLKGEISNFKAHTRGHYYFTLKDENSRLNAVMFSYYTNTLKFTPSDGMRVLAVGRVSIYEPTGSYQIYVESMVEDGIGNLYVAFEKLKNDLAKEGLFNAEHKKKIPRMPKKIGIVTASTGAAIRDILTTIKRRYPICETILFPSLVQGSSASADIAHKIEIANTYDLDTLIVGRGGGSLEDLWPFNEEIVARAIYNSRIPVISAVGHEIDFTIADFVADLRAPTPTAAAELAVPNMETILNYLETAKSRSYQSITNIINNYQVRIDNIENSYILKNPTAMYDVLEQRLDNLIDKLNKEMSIIIENNKVRLFKCSNSYMLCNPTMLYKFKEQNLINLMEKLEVLNPISTINRGYGIVKKDNKVISSINNVNIDDDIVINLKDGNIYSKIVKVSDINE